VRSDDSDNDLVDMVFGEHGTRRGTDARYDSDNNSDSESDSDSNSDAEKTSGRASSSSSSSSARETADEKRLRLAEEFLQSFQAKGEKVDDRHDDDDDEIVNEGVGGAEAQRLRGEMRALAGRARWKVADRFAELSEEAAAATVPPPRRCRGHANTPTCLALSADDAMVVSGGKDCSVARWDVESGALLNRAKGSRAGVYRSDGKTPSGHRGAVLATAISSDSRYYASGGVDRFVHVWDARTDELVHSFAGHRDTVSALAFRHGSADLYSGSHDRTVKAWNVADMAYVDTLYGHQSEINAIDALHRPRAITAGADNTVRVWRVIQESQLVFRGHSASIDAVRFLNENAFFSGSQDGSVALWNSSKKKPVAVVQHAHRVPGTSGGWVSAVATLVNSDLAASGSHTGQIKLWQCKTSTLRNVYNIDAPGVINGLAIAKRARFIAAAIGREHRLGRWFNVRGVRDHLVFYTLPSFD
jgi:ribosomal RNA-processing protein 9